MDLDDIHEFAEQFAKKNGFNRWIDLVIQNGYPEMDGYACNLLYDWKEALTATDKPVYVSNGWQTITNYAKEHGITYRHVFKLIKHNAVLHMKIAELNNVTLVKDK